ncbi:amino acid adenylation domain-containing protein [Variovorax boronicumulans]|uniref:amino acid adenylation domain-containing protein n=1 Tax=Variovorax boronicumulans TaxID=436515 RepID=UPI00339B5ED4
MSTDDPQAPLSWGQRQMYRAMQVDAQPWHFHMTDVLVLRGAVDLELLARSLAQALAAQPSLHVKLAPCADGAEGVVQRFDGLMPTECPVHDWSDRPCEEVEARLLEMRAHFGRTPFDLAAGPLFRVALVRLRADEACLLLTLHHLLADDWSMGLLQQDVAARYAGAPLVSAEPAPYFEFARRQEAWLQSREGERAVAWWSDRLQGLPAQFPIPSDRPRPVAPARGRATVSGSLAGELVQSLRQLGREARSSLFVVLLAAYKVLLWRLALSPRVPVATLVGNRDDGVFDRTVGLFFNTIVLVSELRHDQPFRDFVADLTRTTLDGMQRQAVPFQHLVDRLCPVRDPARVPFAQAMFSFMAASSRRLRIGDAELEQFGGIDTGSAYDLKVTAYEKGEGVEVLLEYDADLFDAATVQAWHEAYLRILADAAAAPLAPVQALGFAQASAQAGAAVVRDAWGADVPAGFAGELCRLEGGEAVRTGLLARRLADGRIQPFEARPATWVVNGETVEVALVERCAQAVPGVRQALLTFDAARGLVLHLVIDAEPFRLPALRRQLVASVPAHCVPGGFRVVPWIAERIGGIPDLDALWQIGRDADAAAGRAAGDAREAAMLAIWSQAMRVPALGPDDDFLGAGGNSLTAALIVAQANQHLGAALTLRHLFEARTAARFAALASGAPAAAVAQPWHAQPQARSAQQARVEVDGRVSYPASEAQARMWMLDRLLGPSDRYVLRNAFRVAGPLDARALGAAFEALVRRHEQLRAVFLESDGLVRQCLLPADGITLREVFWDAEPGPDALPPATLVRELDAAFDLRTGPLARALLVRTRDPEVHQLHLALHHSVADGWSLGVLFDDWLRLYAGDRALPALPAEYRDHCCWRISQAGAQVHDEDLAYWRRQLEGADATLPLPERPAGEAAPQQAGRRAFRLPAALCERLGAIAAAEDATVYTVLLAGFAAVLARYAGQKALSIGAPVANRDLPGTDRMVGLFVNTVVMRLRIGAAASLRELLRDTRDTVLAALAHAAAPFEAVVQALQPQRHLDASPLFELMFAFQNLPGVSSVPGELALGVLRQDAARAKFKLGCTLTQVEGVAYGELEFREDLLDPALMERLAADYVAVLTQWAGQPDAACHALRVAVSRPRPVTGTASGVAGLRAAWEIVQRQALRTPERAALRHGTATLSYVQLDAAAARIAAALRARGLGAGHRIGLCLPRSPRAIVGLLGILRAGAAYSPMDADAQDDAWREHASGARLDAILRLPDARAWPDDLRALDLEELLAATQAPAAHEDAARHPQAAAVIFRTSGSTGQPKYVTVPHEGIVALVAWGCEAYDADTYRHASFATALGFDVSLFEMFVPWALGGCAVLMDHLLAPREEEPALSCISGTPSQVRALLGQGRFPAGAVTLNMAGEALPPELVTRVFAQTQTRRIFNLYGPTECSVYASFEEIRRDDRAGPVRIGRPQPHVTMHVLDAMGRETPQGVAGEICIGGSGLAHGYTGQAALTAEHFVPDPFSGVPGARMYRTRDIGRVDGEGAVTYVGRADGVQKLRGIWVNFDELAADVRACPGVRDAVVLPVAEREGGGDGGVVAFCVPEDGTRFDEAALRRLFRARVGRTRPLAYGRIVNRFVALDALPLLPSGKVDLQSLARMAPGRPVRERASVAPTDLLWHLLREAWGAALGIEDVGEGDDFFALGGHSLLALRMLAAIEASSGLALPFATIFEFPVFTEFADEAGRIASGQAGPDAAAGPIDRLARTGGDDLPVSRAQRRLWFLDQFEPGTHHNVPLVLRLQGATHAARLGQAVHACLQEHEVFRTSFHFADGDVVARIAGEAPAGPVLHDWSALAPEARREREAALRQAHAAHRFDLSRPGLVRIELARLAHDEWLVAMVLHHIVTDGESIALLAREIGRRYAQPGAVSAPRLQYVDYAAWDRRGALDPAHQAHLAYWKTQLDGAPAFLSLPADHPRPVVSSHAGAAHAFFLPEAELAQAGEVFAQLGVSRFMGLLATFKLALYHHTGSRDLCIGTPVTNRRALPTRAMQGYFLDMLVLRTRFAATDTLADFIGKVRALCGAAFRHQAPGFDAVVDLLQPERTPGYHPLFQLAFVYTDGGAASADETPGLRWTASQGGNRGTQFDLTCHCNETPDGLWVTLDHKATLYAPQTIAAFGAHFRHCLARLCAHLHAPIAAFPTLAARACVPPPRNAALVARGDSCLADGFERWAARTPEAIALRTTAAEFSYATIETEANRLSHRLLRDGLRPGEPVALCLDRNETLVVALLAVSKAGGCFVPLDSQIPPLRLRAILARHGIRRLVSTQALLAPLLSGAAQPLELSHCYDFGARTVSSAWRGIGTLVGARDWAGESSARVPSRHRLALPAYVIFTSGSTGEPKGVVVGDAAACATLDWINARFGVGPGDRLLWCASVGFDLSIYDVFGTLGAGATVCIADRGMLADPVIIASYLALWGVTIWDSAPAALQFALSGCEVLGAAHRCDALRLVMLSGDRIPVKLPAAGSGAFPNAHWHALGGATEAAVWSNHYEIGDAEGARALGRGAAVPYGRGFGAAAYFVMNDDFQVCPDGVEGELFIGGGCLAYGYLDAPGLTAQRFVPHPFEAGARLYRTGDRVRRDSTGTLWILGRQDGQVKLRGFRIELGEVEQAIQGLAAVKSAVVLKDATRDALHAHVELHGTGTLAPAVVQEHLAARLPHYMIPSAIHVVEAWPMTANGKLDRERLARAHGAAVAPRRSPPAAAGTVAHRLAAIWEQVLQVPVDDAQRSFFHYGGSSLDAIEMLRHANAQFGTSLRVTDIFHHQTLALFAARIEQRETPARTDDGALTIWKAGDGTAPALVFIAPPGADGACYAALLDELTAWPGALCTAALTLPLLRRWHGGAERTLDALGRLLADAIAQAGIARFVPCGWSFGGTLAARLPGRGERALLIDAYEASAVAGGLRPEDEDWRDWQGRMGEGLLPAGADAATRAELFSLSLAVLGTGGDESGPAGQGCLALIESNRPDGRRASAGWPLLRLSRIDELDAHHYEMLRQPWVKQVAAWIGACLARNA